MAKNGAENGAAPKAKIAKKVGRRTKCTEDYVARCLERIEAGQSVPAAAAVAALHISTVMEWLAREPENPGGQWLAGKRRPYKRNHWAAVENLNIMNIMSTNPACVRSISDI
jgi:hypothetical protein